MKGWRGKKSVSWLEPAQAFALFVAADVLGAEFGMFLRLLCYTGMRLGEALAITIGDVDLSRQAIYLPETKNGDALIRFHASGRLRELLKRAMAAAGLSLPRRQRGFHLFRHTWATWMRRYAGLDRLTDTSTSKSAKKPARLIFCQCPSGGSGRVRGRPIVKCLSH